MQDEGEEEGGAGGGRGEFYLEAYLFLSRGALNFCLQVKWEQSSFLAHS